MKENNTTKRGKEAAGVEVTTSSPYGQEELEQQTIVEQKGDAEVPQSQPRKKNPPVHSVDMPQNRNSKHTGRSPRTAN